jgi:hypothetical protein
MNSINYPRPFTCPECTRVLGFIVQGDDRVRRLYVLRLPRSRARPVPSFDMYNYSVLRLDQGDVPCLHCEQVYKWKMGKDAFVKEVQIRKIEQMI